MGRPQKDDKAHFRGHPITWDGQAWRFDDTNEPTPGYGGDPIPRPCAKCGAQMPLGEGEVDECLGVLPGVDNACCGHGIREEAYIRFTSGVVVEGFVVTHKPRRGS